MEHIKLHAQIKLEQNDAHEVLRNSVMKNVEQEPFSIL